MTQKYEGVVNAHPKGFGFVTCEDLQEFFVPPALMRELLPFDKIRFTLESGRKAGAQQVAQAWIVERRDSTWQGTLRYDRGVWLLEPDEPCFVRLEVRGVQYAQSDEVVSVKVPAISSAGVKGSNKIAVTLERILGLRTRPGFDLDYALAKFNFEPFFPASVFSELPKLGLTGGSQGPRKDMRDVPFVTIDGEHTKDIDDALWAQKVPSGGWHIKVAIADVSHFVREGSALDVVASKRMTSVYLPGKTIPMLPEELSNGECSLLPGLDRFAVVVSLKLNEDGSFEDFELTRATVRSAQRLTYDEVLAWKSGQKTLPAHITQSLEAAWSAYEALAHARKERGHLEFEDKEPKLLTHEDGSSELAWTQRHDAHKMVEELMLLTNQSVGRELNRLFRAALYRHQPHPVEEAWQEMREWAQSRTHELDETPSLRAVVALAKNLPAEERFKAELQARATMQPALYSSQASSHFSLGYEHYTHFTSPIRRYADLLVHRLLLKESTLTAPELAHLARLCSERNRDARLAERWVWDRIKKRAAFHAVGPGQSCPGHIVRQNAKGARVVLNEWQCTAWVASASLAKAGWVFSESSGNWEQGKLCLELGSQVCLKLTGISEQKTRIELDAQLV